LRPHVRRRASEHHPKTPTTKLRTAPFFLSKLYIRGTPIDWSNPMVTLPRPDFEIHAEAKGREARWSRRAGAGAAVPCVECSDSSGRPEGCVTCVCGQPHPLASRRVGCLSQKGREDGTRGMEERAAKTRTIVQGASRVPLSWEGRLSARVPAPPTFEAATNKPAEGTQQSSRAMTRRIDDASRDRLRSDEWLVITGSTLSPRPHGTCPPPPVCA